MFNILKNFIKFSQNTLRKPEITVVTRFAGDSAVPDLPPLITPRERQTYTQVFRTTDTNKDGILSPAELRKTLKASGLPLSHMKDEDIDIFFDLKGANQNGVNFDTYMKIVESAKMSSNFFINGINFIVRQLDSDRDGKLNKDEVKRVIDLMIHGRQAPDVDQSVAKYDQDKDGLLSYEEVYDLIWTDISPFSQ